VHRIQSPACIDGGDILCVGKDLYIGLSERTDANAVEQIRDFVAPHGYHVRPLAVTGCLHLKSAVTQVGPATLLINPAWVDRQLFRNVNFIETDASEAYAGNALLVGDSYLPFRVPRTQARLAAGGFRVVPVDADELAKAEGAVTCCSLVFAV
jgi:dimethylargininase